jgi:hypothetical protein
MAKKNAKKEKQPKEQLDLIDFRPANIKKIAESARRYRRLVADRQRLLNKEVEEKAKLKALIMENEPKRLSDGSIKFACDGMTISVTPQDEKIQVKESE